MSAGQGVPQPPIVSVVAHAALTVGAHGMTAAGAALVDDADAAAQRATLAVPGLNTANTLTGAQTIQAAATQDAIKIAGRAGGTSSFAVTVTPLALSANRSRSEPDEDGTYALRGANTFTGKQTIDATSINGEHFVVESDAGGYQSNIVAVTYGINGGGVFHGNMARGTKESPTAVQKGDITGGYGSRPHDGSGFLNSSPTSIHFVVSENWDTSHHGSYLRILTTPKGSTVRKERLLICDNGSIWAHDAQGTWDPTDEIQTNPVSLDGGARFVVSTVNDGVTPNPGANFVAVGYGNGGNTPTPGLRGIGFGGTPLAPSAIGTGQYLCFMGGCGYDGSTVSSTKSMIGFLTDGAWSAGVNNGSYISFNGTPNGSTTRAEWMRLQNGVLSLFSTTEATDKDTGAIVVEGGIGVEKSVFAGIDLIAAGRIRCGTMTPASASATGVAGTIAWDENYIYICTATNTWKRVAIATW